MLESRRLILFYLLLVGVIAGVSFYTIQVRTDAAAEAMRERDRLAIDNAVRDLTRQVASVSKDVRFLRKMAALQVELEEDSEPHRQRVIDNLSYFAATHEDYLKLRWIEADGHERIRVERQDNGITLVPAERLEDKSTRPYFTQTMTLPEGSLYVSALDLNVDNGRIAEPWSPTLRIAAPLFNHAGERRGVFVLSFDGRQLVQRVQEDCSAIADYMGLTDATGYWLSGPDTRLQWRFMFNQKETLASRSPSEWAHIGKEQSGQFIDQDGLWTWSTAFASDAIRAAGAEVPSVGEDLPSWKVLSHRSSADLLAVHKSIRNPVLLQAGILLLFLTGLTALLVRAMQARQRAERLRDDQEQFRIILDSNLNGLAAVDANDRITFANPAIDAMLGYPTGGLLGQSIAALIPSGLDGPLTQIRRGATDEKTSSRLELKALRRDGSACPVEVALSTMRHKGQLLALIAVVDLTERKRNEAALRVSEVRLRLFIEHAPAAICMLDRNMNYLTASRRWLNDYSLAVDDIAGSNHYEVFPDIPERWKQIHRRALSGQVERADNDPFVRQDGSTAWVRWEIRPWYEDNGQVGGILLFTEVVTHLKEAELALRASEERNRSLVAALSEGVIALGLDGNVVSCNRAAEQILHISEEEMKSRRGGLADWYLLREDGTRIPVAELPAAQTLASGEPRHDVVVGYLIPDGTRSWLVINTEPLVDATSGKLNGVVVSFTDITARRTAENELHQHQEHLESIVAERTSELVARETQLRQAEGRFRSFVERAPIAMVVLREDQLILGNEQFEKLFGSIDQDGSPVEGLWIRSFPDPDARRSAVSGLKLALDGVRSSGRAMPVQEFRMRCADRIWRFLEISAVLLDAGFLVTFVDVTERREHAQQLSELADFNAKVIAGSTQGMLAYRANGQCVMANEAAARLLGGTVEHLLAQNFNFNPVWKEQGFLRLAQKALGSGIPEHGERQYLSSFGLPVWIAFDFLPFTRNGDPHIMMQFADVSAFRQAEAALREGKELAERASQAKGQFVANMSHEIRTPMNAILGLAQILERSGLDANQGALVKKIGVASRALMGIINDILDFSKIEAGQLSIENISFSLTSVLETLSTLMSSSVGDKDLELIIVEPEPIGGTLIGDPMRLQQILINLTSNAIKFTEQGRVEVAIAVMATEGDQLRIRFVVRDTGIGISPGKMANIFDAFVQADSSTTRRFGGSGLGLSICKRLVELMGGRIGADSKPGEGSEFWFELPFTLERTAPTRDPGWKNLRLLVVDDHEAARQVLANTARSLGWQVETAASSQEAIDRIHAQKAADRLDYDVLVMDWQMPELDGLAASRIICNDLSPRKLPVVILVTAHGREIVTTSADARYADAVLTKPVTGSMLYDAVVECVSEPPISAVSTAGQANGPEGLRLSGARVLIVDDSVMNQEIAQRILQLEGAHTSLAGDGQEAVARLSADPHGFDVVLMDVQMPVMDGLQASRVIREDLNLNDLPIVALTAGVLGEERDRVFAAGMNDFLSKPYDVEQMIVKLVHWLQTRPPGQCGQTANHRSS